MAMRCDSARGVVGETDHHVWRLEADMLDVYVDTLYHYTPVEVTVGEVRDEIEVKEEYLEVEIPL